MKINLGDLVYWNDDECIVAIEIYHLNLIHLDKSGDKLFEPVLLTYSLLKSFGIDSYMGKRYSENEFCCVYINQSYFCISIKDGFYTGSIISKKFKYVHELQQLHYALFKVELIVSD